MKNSHGLTKFGSLSTISDKLQTCNLVCNLQTKLASNMHNPKVQQSISDRGLLTMVWAKIGWIRNNARF